MVRKRNNVQSAQIEESLVPVSALGGQIVNGRFTAGGLYLGEGQLAVSMAHEQIRAE